MKRLEENKPLMTRTSSSRASSHLIKKKLKVKNEIKNVCVHPKNMNKLSQKYHTHMHPPNNLLILGYKDPKTHKYE